MRAIKGYPTIQKISNHSEVIIQSIPQEGMLHESKTDINGKRGVSRPSIKKMNVLGALHQRTRCARRIILKNRFQPISLAIGFSKFSHGTIARLCIPTTYSSDDKRPVQHCMPRAYHTYHKGYRHTCKPVHGMYS